MPWKQQRQLNSSTKQSSGGSTRQQEQHQGKMAAEGLRRVPPEKSRSVGVVQMAVVLAGVLAGFILGIAVSLNHCDAVRQLSASSAAKQDESTGLLRLITVARHDPSTAAERGNGPCLESHPAELPVRVLEQPDPPTSGLAPSAMVGAKMAQSGMLTGVAERKKAAGSALGGGGLSLEAAVHAASEIDRPVVFVLVTAANLASLRNWYASVFKAGYGWQAVFLTESVAVHKELVSRWPWRSVLVEPRKLNLTEGPRVAQYIRLLLSFNVTVVYNEADAVWLWSPLGFTTKQVSDVWVTEGQPSDATAANNSAPCYVTPKEATRQSSQQLGLRFMVFRPTPGSRQLLDMWIAEARKVPSADADGPVPFNKAVQALESSQVSVRVFSPFVFMPGHIYFPCRSNDSVRRKYYANCTGMTLRNVAVVIDSGLLGSSGGSSTTAASVQRLKDTQLWFAPDFEELMGLATKGTWAARRDLGKSQAEREALVARVLPGAATRHVDGGMTLVEAVEVVGGPNRTLIFCSASEGYLDFLINWFKSVQRAGQGGKVLFIAEDRVAYDFLRQRWPNQTVLVMDGPAGGGQPTSNSSDSEHGLAAHSFGTALYNTLVDRRPRYFEALLLLNVTFLYNDVDIVWFRDPWPLFTGDYDMWVQEDGLRLRSEAEAIARNASVCHEALRRSENLCTCIMLLRPTPGSLLLVRLWSRALHIRSRNAGGKPVTNQPSFNMALHYTRRDIVKVGVLPFQFFPSGYLYFSCKGYAGCSAVQRLQERYWTLWHSGTIQPAMVHNNWIAGYSKKLERFKATNLWNVTSEDTVPTRAHTGLSA